MLLFMNHHGYDKIKEGYKGTPVIYVEDFSNDIEKDSSLVRTIKELHPKDIILVYNEPTYNYIKIEYFKYFYNFYNNLKQNIKLYELEEYVRQNGDGFDYMTYFTSIFCSIY